MSSQSDHERQHSRAIIDRLRASLHRPSLPWRDATEGSEQTRVPALGTLDIRTSRVGNTCLLKLSGGLDRKPSESLTEMLERTLEHDTRVTVLDLSYLVLIDHAGVHTILTAYRRTTNQSDEFLILRGPAAVQRVIDGIQRPLRYDTRAVSRDRARGGHGQPRHADRHDRVRFKSTSRSPRRGHARCRYEQ